MSGSESDDKIKELILEKVCQITDERLVVLFTDDKISSMLDHIKRRHLESYYRPVSTATVRPT